MVPWLKGLISDEHTSFLLKPLPFFEPMPCFQNVIFLSISLARVQFPVIVRDSSGANLHEGFLVFLNAVCELMLAPRTKCLD